MNKETLYKTHKQRLKSLSKREFVALKELTRLSKNLYNVTLYSIRQHYFQEKKFLRYESNYHYIKSNENYKMLGADISQQTAWVVDRNFRSFFNANKQYHVNTSKFTGRPRVPGYLPKDGHFVLIFPNRRFSGDSFNIPTSREFKKQFGVINIKFPSNVNIRDIAEVRIHPKFGARFFEIEYVYRAAVLELSKLDVQKSLALDLGVNNLVSGVTSTGDTFIISGKPIKSINQWYNKERSRLCGIKDKQGYTHETRMLYIKTQKRKRQLNDYINKTVRKIIDICLSSGTGTVIVGHNNFWKQNTNIGKTNNQKFMQIPHDLLKQKLEYKCKEYGITYIEQEESYTSKASFVDNDIIPIYRADDTEYSYTFSGSRVKRGLYKTKAGLLVNADINGACNILRKSKQNFDYEKLCRGILTMPLSIKIA